MKAVGRHRRVAIEAESKAAVVVDKSLAREVAGGVVAGGVSQPAPRRALSGVVRMRVTP